MTPLSQTIARALCVEEGLDPDRATPETRFMAERAERIALAVEAAGSDSGIERPTPDPLDAARKEFGRVTSWLQGQECDVRAWLDRAGDYASAYVAFQEIWAVASASTDTQEGRR